MQHSDTPLKKKEILLALRNSYGNVTHACRQCEITRQYFYKICREDEDFANEYHNILEEAKDFAEGKLFELINNLNPAAIMFFLKTKARDRGYTEKVEIVSENANLKELFIKLESESKKIAHGKV